MSRVYIIRVVDGMNDDYIRAFSTLKKAVQAFAKDYHEDMDYKMDKDLIKQLYKLAKTREEEGYDMLLAADEDSGLWEDFYETIEVVVLEQKGSCPSIFCTILTNFHMNFCAGLPLTFPKVRQFFKCQYPK